MTLSERFFDHIGNFRRTSHHIVRDIVDELHKPVSLRKYRPEQKVSDEHGVFLDDEDIVSGGLNGGYATKTLFYYIDNICIKLTHQGEQMLDAGNW